MKKTITIAGFIHATKPAEWHEGAADVVDGIQYEFWIYEHLENKQKALVCPVTLEFELPDGFNPRSGLIEGLKAEKTALMAIHQLKLTDIERQISQLLAISNEAS